MTTTWKYSTTLKGSSTDCPTLSLAAAAPVASSLDALLASSILRLDVRVLADGQQLEAASLEGSALVREVRGWFDKQKSSLGFDSVGDCEASATGVSIALNSFSRSARSSMLSRPAVQPQASTAAAAQGLDRLDLTLSFRSTSGRSKPKKPKLSASSSDSQSQSPETPSQAQLSQPPEVTLTSHLLSPSSLHFTLVPQLTTALERLVKKLVTAFPLCFNPRWQDRLANDLPAHHSIAQSLCNILCLGGRKDDLRKPRDSEVEKKAGLLEMTLNSHVAARYLSQPSLASSSSADPSSTHTTTTSLETALFVTAGNASAPDAWTSTKAGSTEGEDGGVKKGRKTGGAGKRKANDVEEKRGGAGMRKKRKTSKSRTDDANGLSAFSIEFQDPSSSPLPSGSFDEEDGQGEGDFEADVGGEEQGFDEGWDLFGDAWA
ncbi:hypothetical protein JCM10296v2_007269 [Rhodotorula toruloides]